MRIFVLGWSQKRFQNFISILMQLLVFSKNFVMFKGTNSEKNWIRHNLQWNDKKSNRRCNLRIDTRIHCGHIWRWGWKLKKFLHCSIAQLLYNVPHNNLKETLTKEKACRLQWWPPCTLTLSMKIKWNPSWSYYMVPVDTFLSLQSWGQ